MSRAQLTSTVEQNTGGAISPYVAGKNKIANGNFEIDQRQSGSAVTVTGTAFQYTLDRFWIGANTGAAFSVQQNKGSVTPPAGFTNYLGIQTSSAKSPSAGDFYFLQQPIEGYNCSDLAWGTSSAKSATLSFWVYSNLTGTFTYSVLTGSNGQAYVGTYSIASANTWTKITAVIPANTSSAAGTGNGVGLRISWDLGSGSNYQGTANAWGTYTSPSDRYTVSGANQIVASTNNYIYFTGIQFEVGPVATPFSRAGGTLQGELALCQRYFQKTYDYAEAPGATSPAGLIWTQIEGSETSRVLIIHRFPVRMRTTATVTFYGASSGTSGKLYNRSVGADRNVTSYGGSDNGITYNTIDGSNSAGQQILVCYTASAEL